MNRATPLSTAALLVLAGSAAAQTYPTKPIRLVVPYVAGGPVDIMGRVTAQRLTDLLGQQVVVDNRAGANGNIGAEIVARSIPDGHSLLFGANGVVAVNPSLYRKMAWDPQKDIIPITMLASSPMLLVAHPAFPPASVRELIDYARARPGTVNYASSGNGSTSHLSTELLRSMTGITLAHVPYKGAATAMADVMSGQLQFIITAVSSTLPFLQSGKLKALGVSSEKRMAVLPNVPAIAETLPGYEVSTWYGIFAPAGTPKAVTDRLYAAMLKIVESTEARDKMATLGAEPKTMTSALFADAIRKETAKWAKVVKESGMRLD